jgi:signal transduction histidine kinase
VLNKIPLRLRLTLLCSLLLAVCCIGLTIILNLSANRMANVIEAIPMTPATSVGEVVDLNSAAVPMAPILPSETSNAARRSFLRESILYMIILVVIGAVLTYYLSGKALKPLNELSSQMKNLTVHNLSEDLEIPKTKDEIADLTYSFNEMSNKLDEAFSMQKRFSQSAAHELRTPLSVLKTKVEVFKKKKNHTPEEYDSLLNVISTHTNRLSELVTDILNFTNMDAMEYSHRVEIKGLLEDIVDELSIPAKERHITVSLDGINQIVIGNTNLLHRAFFNIVENAIKYNHKNGSVNIEVALVNDQTLVTVEDTGFGIPGEMRTLIFEPFFRVDKSRSRQMGGAGLGLTMVKNIIDKHGGQISVLENQNGGSTFSVLL